MSILASFLNMPLSLSSTLVKVPPIGTVGTTAWHMMQALGGRMRGGGGGHAAADAWLPNAPVTQAVWSPFGLSA